MTVDYLPVATAVGANVDTQGAFAGSGYQLNGFIAGLAQSKQANKCWRQSSMVAAMIANFIANRLNISVLDDGNLPNLISEFVSAIGAAQYVDTTVVSVNANVTTQQTMNSFTIPANSLNAVGKVLRITASGTFVTSGSAENVQFGIGLFGATEIPVILPVSAVVHTIPWRIVCEVVVVTAGSSGSLVVSGTVETSYSGVVATGPAPSAAFFFTQPAANLTIGQLVAFEVLFSVASASNVGNQYLLMAENLN